MGVINTLGHDVVPFPKACRIRNTKRERGQSMWKKTQSREVLGSEERRKEWEEENILGMEGEE